MFACYENGQPCLIKEDTRNLPKWKTYKFETLSEAMDYMDIWMGILGPFTGKVNKPMIMRFPFNMTFEIREEK